MTWQNWKRYALPTVALFAGFAGANSPIRASEPPSPLTCAIAQSEEIQLINDRAALARDQARRSRRTAWADWIDPNPINILGNLLGGGRVGRRRVAIARLNLQAAALEPEPPRNGTPFATTSQNLTNDLIKRPAN